QDCVLMAANTTIRGGKGGMSCGAPAVDGNAGDGLVLIDSTSIVRGASTDTVKGGPWDPVLSAPGSDIVVDGGKLVISGVTYDPADVVVTGGGTLDEPAHIEPWFSLNDAAGEGDLMELSLAGPAGAS